MNLLDHRPAEVELWNMLTEVRQLIEIYKVYTLHNVQITESKLKGLSFNQFEGDVVIPTDQIKKVEVHEFSLALTSLGVILIIGMPIVALGLAWQYDELNPGN